MKKFETLILMMTYNSAQTLRKSLDDLMSQEYQDFLLFIVDDCSQDASYDICLEYAEKHENILLLRNEKNRGGVANFGYSLRMIQEKNFGHKFFLWACPDDEWHSLYLEKCIQTLKESHEYVACQSYLQLIYHQENKSYLQKYQSHGPDATFEEIAQIFYHLSPEKKLQCYNQCIHSVVRSEYVNKLFPLQKGRYKDYLMCELSIVGLMIAYGGLKICEMNLSNKNVYGAFEELNPQDAFTQKRSNKLNYLKSCFSLCPLFWDSRIKNYKILLKVFICNINFYCVRFIKIFLYENFIKYFKKATV